MTLMQLAKLRATELAKTLTKITMTEFFKQIHSEFYSDQDISFMEYFLELTEHEDEFIVDHHKLIEYGVVISLESGNVKKKLAAAGLENGVDFTLVDITERGKSGAQTHKLYTLTPKAFKQCLMRARKYAGQPIDPTIYSNYYLFLERVYKLYTDYERAYLNQLLSIKDDKLDLLLANNQELLKGNKELRIENKQQSLELKQLLVRTNHIVAQNDMQLVKIDQLKSMVKTVISLAQITIPTWIGASVLSQQLDILTTNKDRAYALKHMKVMFMVGFYVDLESPVEQTKVVGGKKISFTANALMKVYACCTNFADIGARIKLLHKRHDSEDSSPRMRMLCPKAVTLISCEINLERVLLEHTDIFPAESTATWNGKFKSYDLLMNMDDFYQSRKEFARICQRATSERFQGYQRRLDDFNRSSDIDGNLGSQIVTYIDGVDNDFYTDTLPYCQQYIGSYITYTYGTNGVRNRYSHVVPGRTQAYYADVERKLTANGYTLHKIEMLLEQHNREDHVQHMIDNGMLTEQDLPLLRAIAKFENIDVGQIEAEYQHDLELLEASD